MNVSVHKIVHHMEEQLVVLRKKLAEGDERAVKECAAAIEAYCQLFKEVSSETQPTQRLEKKPTMPIAKEHSEEDLGNLLDF